MTTTTTIEQQVRERLDRAVADAERELARLETTASAAVEKYAQAFDEECELFALYEREPTPENDAAAMRAGDACTKHFTAAQRAEAAASYAATKLAELRSDGEFNRRVSQAERLAEVKANAAPKVVTPKRPTLEQAAVTVLSDAGGPLHVREITKRALDQGLWRTKGKSPQQTLSAALALKHRAGETFIRVAPSIYDLRERGE